MRAEPRPRGFCCVLRHLVPQAKGAAIVADTTKDDKLVQTLIDLRLLMDRVVADAFHGSAGFTGALRVRLFSVSSRAGEMYGGRAQSAFEASVNQRESKPAELIAKYMDQRMRSGKKVRAAVQLRRVWRVR